VCARSGTPTRGVIAPQVAVAPFASQSAASPRCHDLTPCDTGSRALSGLPLIAFASPIGHTWPVSSSRLFSAGSVRSTGRFSLRYSSVYRRVTSGIRCLPRIIYPVASLYNRVRPAGPSSVLHPGCCSQYTALSPSCRPARQGDSRRVCRRTFPQVSPVYAPRRRC